MLVEGGPCRVRPSNVSRMPDTVTMDKIVSLARRRGFVFPSSEIYGGLGSAYDYGHYGVLLKENVKARWLEAMVRERDDIVALDSSIILHPRVWEASGHVDRLLRPARRLPHCKLPLPRRSPRRPEHEEVRCGRGRASAPARARALRPHRAAPVQPHVPDAHRRARGDRPGRLPPPRDRAGHLRQLQERRPDRAPQAAVRHRAGRQGVPQRDHARELHLPHARVRADGDGVLRPAGRGRGVVPLLGRAARRLAPALRPPREPPARAAARGRRSSRTTRPRRATSSTSSRSAGRSSRESRTAATST